MPAMPPPTITMSAQLRAIGQRSCQSPSARSNRDRSAQWPIPNLADGRRNAVDLPRSLRSQGTPEDRLPETRGVVDGLVPRAVGHTLDLAVKEERPGMLRGLLGNRIRGAGVILDDHEAAVRVVFLPEPVKHLVLDFVVLGAGLAPRAVERLIRSCTKW